MCIVQPSDDQCKQVCWPQLLASWPVLRNSDLGLGSGAGRNTHLHGAGYRCCWMASSRGTSTAKPLLPSSVRLCESHLLLLHQSPFIRGRSQRPSDVLRNPLCGNERRSLEGGQHCSGDCHISLWPVHVLCCWCRQHEGPGAVLCQAGADLSHTLRHRSHCHVSHPSP